MEKNKIIDKEIRLTKKVFIDDIIAEFLSLKDQKKLTGNQKIYINDLIDYELFNIFYGYYDYNPYLDKKYLDICWFEVDGKIINTDDIYCDILESIKEDIQEKLI